MTEGQWASGGMEDARMMVQLSEGGQGIIWRNEAEWQDGGRDPTWDMKSDPTWYMTSRTKPEKPCTQPRAPPAAALLTLVIHTFHGF